MCDGTTLINREICLPIDEETSTTDVNCNSVCTSVTEAASDLCDDEGRLILDRDMISQPFIDNLSSGLTNTDVTETNDD